MHKLPDIPIVEIGPGSQPQDENGELEYMTMPSSMETYHQPNLPEADECGDVTQAISVLEAVQRALNTYQAGNDAISFGLNDLDANSIDFINQTLGEGEVSISHEENGLSPIKAQEAVLAGIWRVQHFNADGAVIRDTIEVGEVPHMVRHDTFANTDQVLDESYDNNNPEIQNAPSLLVELADKLRSYQTGNEAHIVNLSLLPLSPTDLALLGERMGVGPVTILSRGYGNCRIGSTAKRNGWWIKFYNSQDALILNTIEIVDIPSVAIAAPEDIADSADRLNEILEMYR
jgi:hydrogenase-1 operon protein HyaF